MSIVRHHVGARLSETAIFNRTIYLAGQVAESVNGEPLGDIEDQTNQVLGHIDRLLGEADSDKSRLLSVQIYITDMANFDRMNLVWDAWVKGIDAPPRATVEARLANPACLVEIVVVAAQRD